MTLQSMHYRQSAPELLFFNLFIFRSPCASQKRLRLITHMKKYTSAKTDELNHYALKAEKLCIVTTYTFQTRRYDCVISKCLINESHIQA